MAIVLLQSNKANVVSGQTSWPCTFNSAVTPGSLLVVYAGSTATSRTFTASDSVNGAWNNDAGGGSGQGSSAILSFPNTAAGTPTVTATMSGAAGEIDLIIEEWGGILTTSPKDQSQTSNNSAATSAATGTTGTLSQTNELCLGCIHTAGNAGASYAVTTAGWTAGPQSPNPSSGSILMATAYFLPGGSTTAVSASFSWTNSVGSRGAIATYKSAPTAPPPPQFYNRKNVLYFI